MDKKLRWFHIVPFVLCSVFLYFEGVIEAIVPMVVMMAVELSLLIVSKKKSALINTIEFFVSYGLWCANLILAYRHEIIGVMVLFASAAVALVLSVLRGWYDRKSR